MQQRAEQASGGGDGDGATTEIETQAKYQLQIQLCNNSFHSHTHTDIHWHQHRHTYSSNCAVIPRPQNFLTQPKNCGILNKSSCKFCVMFKMQKAAFSAHLNNAILFIFIAGSFLPYI